MSYTSYGSQKDYEESQGIGEPKPVFKPKMKWGPFSRDIENEFQDKFGDRTSKWDLTQE